MSSLLYVHPGLEKLSILGTESHGTSGTPVSRKGTLLYLETSFPQGLEGKEDRGEILQVMGWGGPAKQGSVQEGSSAQASAQEATQLGLGRGDARYLDVGLQTSDKNRLDACSSTCDLIHIRPA